MIEQEGVEAFIDGVEADLRAGKYRAQAVLRRYIPKADGRKRPLGLPTIRDRVVQMAAKLVLKPIFEADFEDCSFGFRPERSATQALERLREQGARGGNPVLDADITDDFGSIDQALLMQRVSRRVSAGVADRWTRQFFHDHGLHRLRGTIRHPGVSTMQPFESSPVSRVRETRTHGLKGGVGSCHGPRAT